MGIEGGRGELGGSWVGEGKRGEKVSVGRQRERRKARAGERVGPVGGGKGKEGWEGGGKRIGGG